MTRPDVLIEMEPLGTQGGGEAWGTRVRRILVDGQEWPLVGCEIAFEANDGAVPRMVFRFVPRSLQVIEIARTEDTAPAPDVRTLPRLDGLRLASRRGRAE